MFRPGALVLTLQGKVKQRSIKKATENYSLQENQGWFFIDYAAEEVSLNERFDVLLQGDNRSLLPGAFSIKLISCIDQFGNDLQSVPKGFKTVCKLEFYPGIPSVIKKLPYLDGWDYNPEAISIVKHQDIELAVPDLILRDLYNIIYVQFKISVTNTSTRTIYRRDLVTYLEKYRPSSVSINQIIISWIQLGKLVQKNKNELELMEDNF